MSSIRRQATFHRAALLLGLERGDDVVAWAEGLVAGDAPVPPDLVEVAMTGPDDLSALRHALYPMCDDPEPPDLARELLAVAARDLHTGRRNERDTITLIGQLRRFLPTPADIDDAIKHLQAEYMLATAGVRGDVAEVCGRVRTWLAPFAAV